MKLLVTGASSTLAHQLVVFLLKGGRFSFRVLEHRSPVQIKSCETVSGDLNDIESLSRACKGMDCVLHLAALTHSRNYAEYFKVNVEGTKNLITACKRNDVNRLTLISSAAASKNGGAYGQSKLESEGLVRQSGLEWNIVRPSEIYGPKMKEGIGSLISCVRKMKIVPVIGDGSYYLSPVYIDDVVDAVAQILINPSFNSQFINLCGPEAISFVTLIDRLSMFLKVRRHKVFIPVWVASMGVFLASSMKLGTLIPDQIPRLLCVKDQNISQTSKLISYSPRKLEEGLDKYL